MRRPKGSTARGLIPAVASGFVPGLGQLLNGQTDKAIGVFVVAGVAGIVYGWGIPLIAGAAGLIAGGTWLYGIADGYFTGRRKR